MRHVYLYLIGGLISVFVMTSCQSDLPGEFNNEDTKSESESVISMKRIHSEGIVRLSIDAAAEDRLGVWIDLDGDGIRAEDGAEDVKIFNMYQEYSLENGLKEIIVHGDITYLGAASNEIAEIDISENSYLTTLNVPLNKLTALDVSQNAVLTRLDCSGNNISSLDVSQNRDLVSLWVFDNKITSLDVSNNANLAFLDCSGNSIASLDLSNNTQLTCLLAHNNEIRELNVDENTQLNRLWLFGNPLSEAYVQEITSNLRSVSEVDLWLSNE